MTTRSTLTLVILVSGCAREAPQTSPEGEPAASVDSATSPAGPAVDSAPASWTLSPQAFGPLPLGVPLQDAEGVLGEPLTPAYALNETCDYVRPSAFPPGVAAMVVGDTLVRVDVDSTGVHTDTGFGVGDTEAALVAHYGTQAAVTPHKYTGPEGHYVTVTDPGDPNRLLIFETDGARVVRFYAGVLPAVRWIEGCS